MRLNVSYKDETGNNYENFKTAKSQRLLSNACKNDQNNTHIHILSTTKEMQDDAA